jgi:ECF transporter S component (folate family)
MTGGQKKKAVPTRRCPTLNEHENKFVQQEIAPCTDADYGQCTPAPVEQKTPSAIRRAIRYLIFGNRIQLYNKTAYITYIAVLTALAIVLNFSASFGIGGEAKLTLVYIPLFLTGIYFGPLIAAAVGALSKIVGEFLFLGYMPWTTNIVSAALMGVAVGLCAQLITKPKMPIRIIIGAAVVCFAITLGLNTLAFTYEPFSPYEGMSYWQILLYTAPPRILFQPIVLAFNTAVTILLTGPLDAYFKRRV